MTDGRTRAIPLEGVTRIDLPKGSWSAVVVSDKTVDDNHASLGYSVFTPGFVSDDLSHSVDELCFVVSGRGVIRLEDEDVEVKANDGLFIPAKVWHTIVNTADEDLTRVFSFPWPDYPPTERRGARGEST
jgi:mannose-6-phosphate isomerase-like protein (cupin superfamily)